MINFERINFGPLLLKTTVHQELIDLLLQEGKKADIDMRNDLAGVLESELRYSDHQLEGIVPHIGPYVEQYVEILNQYTQSPIDSYEIDFEKIWINYQHPTDYNPLHSHSGNLSFVIFCNIPDEIYSEPHINSAPRPGALSFYDGTISYGDKVAKFLEPIRQVDLLPQTGDILIFPAYLCHSVQAFKSDVVRITVSGNVRLLNVT